MPAFLGSFQDGNGGTDGIPLQPRLPLWESSGSSSPWRLGPGKLACNTHGCQALQCRTCHQSADRATTSRGNTPANPDSYDSSMPHFSISAVRSRRASAGKTLKSQRTPRVRRGRREKPVRVRFVHHTHTRSILWTFSDHNENGEAGSETVYSMPIGVR